MYLTTDIEPTEEAFESEQIEILNALLATEAETDITECSANEASVEDK
jgi:hypothetical protein